MAREKNFRRTYINSRTSLNLNVNFSWKKSVTSLSQIALASQIVSPIAWCV